MMVTTFPRLGVLRAGLVRHCTTSSPHPVTYPTEDEYVDKPSYPPHQPPEHIRWMDKLKHVIQETPYVLDRQRLININLQSFTESNLEDYLKTWEWQYYLRAYLIRPYAAHTYNYGPYYQYLTKSRLIDQLPSFYDDMDVEDDLESIKERFYQLVRFEWMNESVREPNLEHVGGEEARKRHKKVDNIIHHLHRLIMSRCGEKTEHLATANTSTEARVEAWWWRGGIVRPSKLWKGRRDHWETKWNWYFNNSRLFWYKDAPTVAVRTRLPLAEIEEFDSDSLRLPVPVDDKETSKDPLISHNFDPLMMGLGFHKDPDKHPQEKWIHRFQKRRRFDCVAGYTQGDPCEFGHVAILNSSKGSETVKVEFGDQADVEYPRQMEAHLLNFNFSWLLSQAYFQGFTLLHDITYPLVSQGIVTDGERWRFATSQLNCTELVPPVDVTPRCNATWSSSPLSLFNSCNEETGEPEDFNDDVLRMCLKFYLRSPLARSYNMKPLLPEWGDYRMLKGRSFKERKKRLYYPDRYYHLEH